MSDQKGLSIHDRPNSYIGRSVPRPNARRLMQGRGTYVDDVKLKRLTHVVFVRSPHAHAEIVSIDKSAALDSPGVVAIVTGAEMAETCTPWVGVLTHLAGMKSAPQHCIAIDRACWQGEPVVAVVAETRAQAEDAAELVMIDWKVLPAVTEMRTALAPETPVIHPDLGDNLCWERLFEEGDVDGGFANSDAVVEEVFTFGRHTGVTLEPRAIVADYDPGEEFLTVYQSTQAPHMLQNIIATHLELEEHRVRVICKDVGGSFGIKVHTYPDEIATAALSYRLNRPVKFIADRLESFQTDIHARDHEIKARIGISNDGTINAIEIDDITGVGPYSMYPRTSGIEANQIVNLVGSTYDIPAYRAKCQVVFQNKTMMCQYRAVGHPIAMAVAEGLLELAAAEIGMDPLEVRRKNLAADDSYPRKSITGMSFESLSHHAALDRLLEMMEYDKLRAEQASLREKGIYRGIGFATIIEVTNPSPAFYGVGGARIAAQDGCTIRLDAKGNIHCAIGVTEQGQGTESVVAQVAATAVGVPMDRVRVLTGDTDVTPYGGGTWASRAAGIGGEAAGLAGRALRENILEVAGIMLQAEPESLDIRNGQVVDAADGNDRLGLDEIGRVVYYRGDTLPKDFQAELVATKHYVPKGYPFAFTNGIHASYLEVDTNTGFVKLLKHWVVEDCGTVINPMLVDEQVRGGVVQGLGGALYEECLYSEEGQLLNGNMADYLVPMAAEMPDIIVDHIENPSEDSDLGAKGAGEAGTAGSPAAALNAVNDALRSFDAKLSVNPMTPEQVLRALGKI